MHDKKIGSPILSNGHAAVVPENPSKKQKNPKQSVSKERSEKNTGKIWKRPEVPDEILNPLHHANKKANTALATDTPAHGGVHSQKLQITMEYDLRNKSRADYWARINTEEGVSLAEVWGTKSGKSRTYIVSPYGKLDIESEPQLKKAIAVARRFVTEKKEYASADDSAPESGSDTSDEER